jgi:hypothetical protein
MNFEIGDEVVYNPSIPNLPPAHHRPRDWGKIVKKTNGYLIIKFNTHDYRSKILPAAFTHSPRSPKYFRNTYGTIISVIPDATINFKMKIYKKTYQKALYDLIHVVFSKEIERDSIEFATWTQSLMRHMPVVD